MKFYFLLFCFLTGATAFSQRVVVKTMRQTTATTNLLDGAPGYKLAPIKFVPFVANEESRRKGLKLDSVYNWVDPEGKRHRATGQQILDQVNDVEKALNERGRSFRSASTFVGINKTIPKDINYKQIPTLPDNFLPKNSGTGRPVINTRFNKIRNLNLGGTIYPYLGTLQMSAEFPGSISDGMNIERPAGNNLSLQIPLVLAINTSAFTNIGSCTMELFDNQSKTGQPIYSVPVDIKRPTVQRNWMQVQTKTENLPIKQNDFLLFHYLVPVNNSSNKIPPATQDPKYYFVNFKFNDLNNKPLIFAIENEIVLNNTLSAAILIPSSKSVEINKFNFEVTDPVSHAFGFYLKSNGFKANSSNNPFGFTGKGIDKKSSFSADLSIGAKYYNFGHLISSSEPLSNDLELVSATFSAKRDYYKAENTPPPIRIPGKSQQQDLLSSPDTKFEIKVLGQTITEREVSIRQEVFNQRFFIGPVPCQVTVALIGKAGVNVSGNYTNNSGNMAGQIEPYANLSVEGSGGVDAYIAYAKVVVAVNLLDVRLPIDFSIQNPGPAVVTSSVAVSGLSGTVYFKAGFCIPIPFFDDICKEFTIDIFNWEGPATSYTISNAGVKQ